MKNTQILLLSGLGIGVVAASFGLIFGLSAGQSSKAQLMRQIQQQKQQLASDTISYQEAASQAVHLYRQFAQQYPDDSLTPHYLFQTVQLYRKQEQHRQALHLLDSLYQRYPDYLSMSNPSARLAPKMARVYEQYSREYPTDSLSPQYLFNAVELYKFSGHYPKTIQLLDHLLQQYPDHKKTPYWLFLKGFVYENNLKQLKKAKQTYQAFLKRYPDHNLVKDVRFSLKNLGKSPKEIIKSIQQNKGNDTTSVS